MKHFLKSKYLYSKDNRIRDKELINLIEERDEIEIGTQVVYKNTLLEVVEIEGENVWWEVKKIDKTTGVRSC